MSGGYPHKPPGSGYDYGGAPPPPSQPYAAPPIAHPYGSAPPYGGGPNASSYGGPPTAPPYGGGPTAPPYGTKPPKENKPSFGGEQGYPAPFYGGKPPKENKPSYGGSGEHGYPAPAYGSGGSGEHGYPSPAYGGGGSGGGYPPPAYGSSSPFGTLLPSTFPPGTDPNVIACFQVADQDGSGLIDDKELQRALSSYRQCFSLRTVHLLMFSFTNSNSHKIGPKEFTSLFYSLQSWRDIFERFDRDRSGKIDASELREAFLSLGFSVSPAVLELLVSKFDKTGGRNHAIEYDNFIECCLTVKGLTEKFKEKDKSYSGSATFTYEDFMLTVLPFIVA